MNPLLLRFPIFWAQTVPDEFEMPLLALRRWFWGQTLSSAWAVPGSEGFWAWMLGLLVLLLVALVLQGPVRALGQLLDLPGHIRLLGAAVERLRASARLVMILLGASVISWTSALLLRYRRPSGLADLSLLTRTRSVPEAAVEQGILAGLTPLRDLFSLADLLVLLGIAIFVAFRFSGDRWRTNETDEHVEVKPGWVTVSWIAASVYGLYRLVAMVASGDDLPIVGGLYIEPLVVPVVMLISDGLLASWVLVELRRAERSSDVEPIEVAAIFALLPAAILGCLVVMPARYLATMGYLSLPYVPDGIARSVLAPVLGGWGLLTMQGAAVALVGLVGAAPWCRGGWRGALRGYGRLLRAEGGHLVATLFLGGLAAAFPVGLAYVLVLSLPPQPWVLPAADSYAHYVTLVVGLGLLAALVELGNRSVVVSKSTSSGEVSEALPMVS
ncbi:hypothetical protein [Tautonia marina]|uniref:hypothetical protein n=1 Tax=Tautonia marina TaxID=2653855 RepID=UPI0012607BF3|nr:hypothetical protein [Tautonia marina]